MVKDAKITIRVGDTYTLKVQALGPKSAVNIRDRQLVDIDSATVQVWDVVNQAFLELGGAGVLQDSATITDNIAEYTLGTTFTQTPGDFKMYLTAAFADGKKVTYVKKLKVLAKT